MKNILLTAMLLTPTLLAGQQNSINNERKKQVELRLQLANSLFNENRNDEALNLYLDFVELYPESPLRITALANSAVIYERKQRFMLAVAQYQKLQNALGNSARGLAYYFEQGRLYEKVGLDDKARVVYERIIAANANGPLARKARGRLALLNLLPLGN